MINTLDSLKTAVKNYLGWDMGGDIDAFLPDIIRMAEVRLQRDLRLRAMERVGFRMTNPGESDLWLPDKRVPGDWDVCMDIREVCIEGTPNLNLEWAAPDRFTDLRSRSGIPQVYSLVGRSLRLAPVPDRAFKVLLSYYAEIPPLCAKQPTNEVLLSHPDLYLYACLVESVALLRSSVPAGDWDSLYRHSLSTARDADYRARFSKNVTARSPRKR